MILPSVQSASSRERPLTIKSPSMAGNSNNCATCSRAALYRTRSCNLGWRHGSCWTQGWPLTGGVYEHDVGDGDQLRLALRARALPPPAPSAADAAGYFLQEAALEVARPAAARGAEGFGSLRGWGERVCVGAETCPVSTGEGRDVSS
mgnify:CR=1 FL=1